MGFRLFGINLTWRVGVSVNDKTHFSAQHFDGRPGFLLPSYVPYLWNAVVLHPVDVFAPCFSTGLRKLPYLVLGMRISVLHSAMKSTVYLNKVQHLKYDPSSRQISPTFLVVHEIIDGGNMVHLKTSICQSIFDSSMRIEPKCIWNWCSSEFYRALEFVCNFLVITYWIF